MILFRFLYLPEITTLTLSTREFYAVYGKEGDNIVENGKDLGFGQSFLDNLYEMHERMTFIFTSFSTVFQSYRDNGRMIM